MDQECHQIGHAAHNFHIDYLGLVETNLNWSNIMLTDSVKTIFRKYWNQTITKTSSTPTLSSKLYQPGGTLSILGNNWTGGATAHSDHSGMGRWTEMIIHGRDHQKLHIINTYRVPTNNINQAGSNTSYYHQWHHLCRQGTQAPNPRAQLLTDLSTHLHAIQRENTAIIIVMDSNEAYTDYKSPLLQWIQSHHLIDTHMALHHLDTTIPTYDRGSKRIDYIFATENIIPYITQGGILSYHFLTSMDHRALYIDIELHKFLRRHPPPHDTSVTQM